MEKQAEGEKVKDKKRQRERERESLGVGFQFGLEEALLSRCPLEVPSVESCTIPCESLLFVLA